MLRTMLLAPTGWCFVNDPSRSNNSVARDTAWFAFGADYVVPEFAEASLLWYGGHLERKGHGYRVLRCSKRQEPQIISSTSTITRRCSSSRFGTITTRPQNEAFLEARLLRPPARPQRISYRSATRQGLVWCTATGTSDWGIVGWRNVIKDYRLSGATTEVNSECYAALQTMSHMARVLGKHDESEKFKSEAEALRAAINAHLFNKETGLYYLNIDIDGIPRTRRNIGPRVSSHVRRGGRRNGRRNYQPLSAEEFWTEAGIHTVPRNAVDYGPVHGYGLLGGVWVGATFWYAFAAAKFNPGFMAESLSQSFCALLQGSPPQ